LAGRTRASDARHYRIVGVPSVMCGLTPNNLGVADEFVEIDELLAVAKIHTLAALNFLTLKTSIA
jgi:succinyl-diaminopimelate desuccinylase